MTGIEFLSQYVTGSWCETTHKPLQNPRKIQKFRLTVGLSRRIRKLLSQDGDELSYLDSSVRKYLQLQRHNIESSLRFTVLPNDIFDKQIAVAVWEQFLFVLVIVPRNVRPGSTNATSLSKKGHTNQ